MLVSMAFIINYTISLQFKTDNNMVTGWRWPYLYFEIAIDLSTFSHRSGHSWIQLFKLGLFLGCVTNLSLPQLDSLYGWLVYWMYFQDFSKVSSKSKLTFTKWTKSPDSFDVAYSYNLCYFHLVLFLLCLIIICKKTIFVVSLRIIMNGRHWHHILPLLEHLPDLAWSSVHYQH